MEGQPFVAVKDGKATALYMGNIDFLQAEPIYIYIYTPP